jgi:hypothetical protein
MARKAKYRRKNGKWKATTEKERHPLYNSWAWIMRYRGIRGMDESWRDFYKFVDDVGERPSKHHSLYRKDDDKPIGPKNFLWGLRDCVQKPTESRKEYLARFQREYRKKHPHRQKHQDCKRIGITLDEYEEMFENQRGKCGICGNGEKMKLRGKIASLAIDHCHDTGKIRGLLCNNCNRGLGFLNDDVKLLEKAILYLKTY